MTPSAKRYSPRMQQSGHQKARKALRLLKRACSAQASDYSEREYGQFNKLTCKESDQTRICPPLSNVLASSPCPA